MVREWVLPLVRKAHAYKRCFLEAGKPTKDAELVLKDLAKFCRAHEPTMVVSPVSRTVDPIASAHLEGRREVWLRLMWHLKIDEADLINTKEDDHE